MSRVLLTAVILILAQVVPIQQSLQAEGAMLSPPSRVNSNSPDIPFACKLEAWSISLFIYKLDALEGVSGAELARRCGELLSGADSDIRFDLRHAGRKGWTRYYPFSMNGSDFIAKVFLTSEERFQAREQALFEAVSEKYGVTFQILPSVNGILKGCNMRPYDLSANSESDTSV